MGAVWARLRYLARTAWVGLTASPVTSGVATFTIAVSLVLVGAFALLVSNMEGLLRRFGEEVRLTAYLATDLPEQEQRALAEALAERADVESAEWVSRELALERFKGRVGGELLEGLDENPLPASVEILLAPAHRSQEGLERVASEVARLAGVDEVSRGHAWVESYARAVSFLRAAGLVLGGVLVLAALLIVANTIRLAVYARRDELEILRLVGATRTFTAAPFLLEGLVQGIVGGLAALAVLYLAYLVLASRLQEGLTFVLGSAPASFLSGEASLLLIAGGAALGLLGSAAAVLQGLRS